MDKGFVWPKDANGNWIEPFDPKFSGGPGGRDYTTENSAYTSTWDVTHDLKGLTELMGGFQAANAKLDQLFRVDLGRSKSDYFAMFPDSTGLEGQFVMGNEPSLAIPYIYNHLETPWKTQKRVRQLLDFWFTDTHLGVPGDEDGGGLSAFVVFSMLGFYPVTPGVPTYELPAWSRIRPRHVNCTKQARNSALSPRTIQLTTNILMRSVSMDKSRIASGSATAIFSMASPLN